MDSSCLFQLSLNSVCLYVCVCVYICLLLKRIIKLLQNQKTDDNRAWIAHVTENQLASLIPEASWKSVLRRTVGGGGGGKNKNINYEKNEWKAWTGGSQRRKQTLNMWKCALFHTRWTGIPSLLICWGCGCGESDTRLCWECVELQVCWREVWRGMACLFRSHVKLLRKALRTYFQ